MPSPDPVTSTTINYRLILTQYHQVSTIAVQYRASSPRKAQLSQLDLVFAVFGYINIYLQLRCSWKSWKSIQQSHDYNDKSPPGSDHLSRRIKSDAGIHKSDLPTDYTRAVREEGIDGLTSYATLLDCREISDNLVKCSDYPRKASSPPPLVITPSFAKSPPSTRFDETANSRVGMIKDIVNTWDFFLYNTGFYFTTLMWTENWSLSSIG